MKYAKQAILALAAFLIFACSSLSIHAQGFGTIVGTVTDPSGSVIPSAKITVVEEGTQATRSVAANDQGYYVVPALRPSTYNVTVESSGFSKFAHKNVTVLADQSVDYVIVTSRLSGLWERWGEAVRAEAHRIGRTVDIFADHPNALS